MERCEFCFGEYDPQIALGVCPYCGYYKGYQQADPRFLPLGTEVNDRYVVGGVIGSGGFGITYRAWDKILHTVVALKEYYQQGVVNRVPGTKDVFIVAKDREEEFHYGKNRLLEEARIVSKFQSKPIVRVNDFFEENGTSYMVMEYLDYPTLTEVIREERQPLEPELVTAIGIELCDALEEIHGAGVLHRDVAPDNMFITEDGGVKIIDFGSARLSKDDTMERLILVKEGFSPVEQYEVLDPKQNLQQPWTDVYALGATLYYLVTGIRPEESRVRKAHVDAGEPDMKEPMELNAQVSENLNNTIMRALAINSHERFKSASEMRKALQGKVAVQSLGVIRRRKKITRTVSILAAFAAAAAVALIAIFSGATQYDKITLEETDLSVWFPVAQGEGFTAEFDGSIGQWSYTASTEPEDAKALALLKVIGEEAASAQFDQVTVSVCGIPSEDYEQTLMAARTPAEMPSLFVCTNPQGDYMSMTADVSGLSKNLTEGTRNCWFMADYAPMFKTMGCIPTAAVLPVIYVNTAIVTDFDPELRIDSMQSLMTLAAGELRYMPIAVAKDASLLYADMLPDYSESLPQLTLTDKDAFLKQNAAVFLGLTSDYGDVQENLIGAYKVLVPGGDKTTCFFSDFWAMTRGDEAQEAAAEVMLAYFFADNAQNTLFLRKASAVLPVNKTAFSRSVSVYNDFEALRARFDRFVFLEAVPSFIQGTRVSSLTDCGGDPALCALTPFVDAPKYTSWAHAGMEYCVREGIIRENEAMCLRPKDNLLRGELVSLLWNHAGAPTGFENPFADVPEDSPYRDAIAWAADTGIVTVDASKEVNEFHQDREATRQELAIMLYRAFNGAEQEVPETDTASFADYEEVSKYARDAMTWIVGEGYMSGIQSGDQYRFDPKGAVTNSQIANIFLRIAQTEAD